MGWLKARREEYAGQYGALDGDQLIGVGARIGEAREQARRHGVEGDRRSKLIPEKLERIAIASTGKRRDLWNSTGGVKAGLVGHDI
jgi:hypothetical protein